jgi:hypothetical protein
MPDFSPPRVVQRLTSPEIAMCQQHNYKSSAPLRSILRARGSFRGGVRHIESSASASTLARHQPEARELRLQSLYSTKFFHVGFTKGAYCRRIDDGQRGI